MVLSPQTRGKIENCEFEKVKLTGYQASQVGMIGTNTGTITNASLKNIEISVSSTSSYVGVVLPVTRPVRSSNIMAEGDAVDYTSLDGLPSDTLFTYRIVSPYSEGVGGIVSGTKRRLQMLRSKESMSVVIVITAVSPDVSLRAAVRKPTVGERISGLCKRQKLYRRYRLPVLRVDRTVHRSRTRRCSTLCLRRREPPQVPRNRKLVDEDR